MTVPVILVGIQPATQSKQRISLIDGRYLPISPGRIIQKRDQHIPKIMKIPVQGKAVRILCIFAVTGVALFKTLYLHSFSRATCQERKENGRLPKGAHLFAESFLNQAFAKHRSGKPVGALKKGFGRNKGERRISIQYSPQYFGIVLRYRILLRKNQKVRQLMILEKPVELGYKGGVLLKKNLYLFHASVSRRDICYC